MLFWLRAAAFAVFAGLLATGDATAHPLGNFTINHLSEVTLSKEGVNVRYVLDIAEIPSFQIARQLSADGRVSAAQLDAWAKAQAPLLVSQLHLTADGAAQPLSVTNATARSRPGAGGLSTFYAVIEAHAALPQDARTIAFADNTYPGRIGWKDVIVKPQSEPTRELTAYPNAMLASPRRTIGANITLTSGAPMVSAVNADAMPAAPAGSAPIAARSNQLSDMLARGAGDPLIVLATLLLAVVLGSLHALEPGHGKTLLAITLVGARATTRQAAILAGALTVAHTAAVLALGLAISLFKGILVPETIYPWITLLSGAAIAFIGARAVQRQVSERWGPARRRIIHEHTHAHDHAHPHAHAHDHAHPHDHGHEHLEDLEHARQHALPGKAPLKFGPAVWAAMSGGIAPCPAALVVLLAAIALNQVAYGIVIIVAFSLGLALTLTGVGVAVVRGAHIAGKHPLFARVVTNGPIISATIMAALGCFMLGRGFAEQGSDVSPMLVSLLAAAAVAGYAFSHVAGHIHPEAA